MIVHVTDIEWDTDNEDTVLPREFDVKIDFDDLALIHSDGWNSLADIVSDTVSRQYGFCHKGFRFTIKKHH